MAMHFLIPFCVLVVFNPLIILVVRKSRETVLEFQLNDSSGVAMSVSELQADHMAESVNVGSTLALTENSAKFDGPTDLSHSRSLSDVSVATVEGLQKDNKKKCKQNVKSSKTVERQMTRMFFAVTISVLILLLPVYIRTVFFIFCEVEDNDVKIKTIFTFCLVVSRTLLFTTYAINFYLYVIVSEKFRQLCRQLFNCKK
jgi:hypothetical protein